MGEDGETEQCRKKRWDRKVEIERNKHGTATVMREVEPEVPDQDAGENMKTLLWLVGAGVG